MDTCWKTKIRWVHDSGRSWVDMWLGHDMIGSYSYQRGYERWSILFLGSASDIQDERLPADTTEEQVRHHMTMKYLLLRGED